MVVVDVLDNRCRYVRWSLVGMLLSIVASWYYVRYSVAKISSMPIPPAVLCRVDVEACVCVASGIRCGAVVQRREEVESSRGKRGGWIEGMITMTRMIK